MGTVKTKRVRKVGTKMSRKQRDACGRRYDESTKKTAIRLYKKGLSIAEICRRKEMPNNTKVVRRWLTLKGVEIRSAKIPQYPRAKILKRLKKGESRQKLMDEFGCSSKFLSNLANGKITP